MQVRQEHEKRGVAQIAKNRKKITTESAFLAWLLLGGHGGIANYLDGSYHKSVGMGW
jgi:hypothetical protein